MLTSLRAPEVPPWERGGEWTTTFTGSPGGPESVSAFYLFEEVDGDGHGLLHRGEGRARAGGPFRGGTWSLPLHLNRATILLLRLRVERRSGVWNKGKC